MKKLFYCILLSSFIFTISVQDIKAQGADPNTPIFEIKNDLGQTVFAVYPGGVSIFINDQLKATGGGFKVGRIGTEKNTGVNDIFTVDPGEVNVFLDDNQQKATGGGFKVGRIGTEKSSGSPAEYFRVTPDSTRVYVRETSKEGFGVGKLGNSEIGTQSFLDLTPENYFIGHRSGVFTTGLYNTFLGFESGAANTTGVGNTFIGYKAGIANTGGTNNIYFGYESGQNNIDGDLNVFIGHQSGLMSRSNSHYNIFMGAGAGRDKTEGYGNVIIGKYAGVNTGSGNYNVILGNLAGSSQNFDPESGFEPNNNVVIGRRAGYAGIGKNNVMIGAYAGYSSDPLTSNGNIFIGDHAGYSETGSNKLYISNSSTPDPLIFGDFAEGKVQVNGDLYATGEITSISDMSLKTNLSPITSGLEIIEAINGYYYDWNDKAQNLYKFSDKKQIGLMAQELEKVLPLIVAVSPKGYKSVNYSKLTPVLVEAIKEQNSLMQKLEERVQKLEESNESLKNELKKMKELESDIEELKSLIKEMKKE